MEIWIKAADVGRHIEGYQVIEVFDFDRPAIQRSWCETSAYSDSMNEMANSTRPHEERHRALQH
jgi:hypothetical protein